MDAITRLYQMGAKYSVTCDVITQSKISPKICALLSITGICILEKNNRCLVFNDGTSKIYLPKAYAQALASYATIFKIYKKYGIKEAFSCRDGRAQRGLMAYIIKSCPQDAHSAVQYLIEEEADPLFLGETTLIATSFVSTINEKNINLIAELVIMCCQHSPKIYTKWKNMILIRTNYCNDLNAKKY